MQETQVRSLGGEDPLEKEMATQSSILAWRIPWTEEPGGLQSMGLQRVEHDTEGTLSKQVMCVCVAGRGVGGGRGGQKSFELEMLLLQETAENLFLRKPGDLEGRPAVQFVGSICAHSRRCQGRWRSARAGDTNTRAARKRG